jgi:ABC-type antimicrobial peptide transport system permease subunit
MRRLDRNLPFYGVRTIEEQVATAYEREALLAHWAGAFSLLALFLASSGMAAVSWQNSRSRQREFAIRSALGATPRALANEVVGSAVRITAPAVGAGLLLAMAAARLMRSLIFGVTTVDPATAAATVALVSLMTMIATVGSQRLAARTAPHSSLRHE